MNEKHESFPQTVSDVNSTLVQRRVHSILLLTASYTCYNDTVIIWNRTVMLISVEGYCQNVGL